MDDNTSDALAASDDNTSDALAASSLSNLSNKEIALRVARWLEDIKRKKGYTNESKFETDFRLPTNTFQHLRDGRLPRLDKILKILVGTKSQSQELINAIFSDKYNDDKKIDKQHHVTSFKKKTDKNTTEEFRKQIILRLENIENFVKINERKINYLIKESTKQNEKTGTNYIDNVFNIHEIFDGLWPRWTGLSVRNGDQKLDTCYQPLDIASGVNLLLRKQNLEHERFDIGISLVPNQDILKEGIKLSVLLGSDQETITSEHETDLLGGLSITMSKGDIFDIIVEYDNKICRNSFYS